MLASLGNSEWETVRPVMEAYFLRHYDVPLGTFRSVYEVLRFLDQDASVAR